MDKEDKIILAVVAIVIIIVIAMLSTDTESCEDKGMVRELSHYQTIFTKVGTVMVTNMIPFYVCVNK